MNSKLPKISIIAKSFDKSKGGIEAWSNSICDYFSYYKISYVCYASQKLNFHKRFALLREVVMQNNIFLLTDWYRIKQILLLLILKKIGIKKNRIIVLIHGDDLLNLSAIKTIFLNFLNNLDNIEYACTSTAASSILRKVLDITKYSVCNPIFEFENIPQPKEISVPKHDFLFFTVSRLVPRKNIITALHAYKRLLKDCKDKKFYYIIAGIGSESNKIEDCIQELQLSDSAAYIGKISEQEKVFLYNNTDLFILPAIQKEDSIEGFGMVYIEAAYHHTPSISGNTGGIVESVIDGETGYHTDGSEDEVLRAMKRALSDRPSDTSLRNHAMQFSIQNNRSLLDLIRS